MNVYVCSQGFISETGPCCICRGWSHTHDTPCVEASALLMFLHPLIQVFTLFCQPSVHVFPEVIVWADFTPVFTIEQLILTSLSTTSGNLFPFIYSYTTERLLLLIYVLYDLLGVF